MELLIVSGLSGAGKSVAMNALEDIGYFCIDNVPAGLLVVSGWKMTGQLAGLGIMLVGVALLLAVLAIYNATYQD